MSEENLTRFLTEGQGPLTSNGVEAGGFLRTRTDLDAPDIQVHFIPAQFQEEGLVPGTGHGFTIGGNVTKAVSRGYVAVVSPDPTAKPHIVHNYYADPEDMRSQVAGLRMCMEIARTAPLAEWASEQILAPASDPDADLEAYVAGQRPDHVPPGRYLQDGRGRPGRGRSRTAGRTGWRACGWWTHRSCRRSPGATPTPRPSPWPRRPPTSSGDGCR